MKRIRRGRAFWELDGVPMRGTFVEIFSKLKPCDRAEKVWLEDVGATLRYLIKHERADTIRRVQPFFGRFGPIFLRVGNFYFYGIENHMIGVLRSEYRATPQEKIDRLEAFYREIGVEKVHATLSSTARSFWNEKFFPEYQVEPGDAARAFFSKSIHPARTQVFSKRLFDRDAESGRCLHYDIKSAYGSVMLSRLPNPVGFVPGAVLDLPGASDVTLSFPFERHFGFGVWPGNDCDSYFTARRVRLNLPNNEIRRLVSEGFTLDAVHDGWHCRDDRVFPLKGYVEFLLSKRSAYREAGDIVGENLCKLMVNVMFGQFHQRPLRTEVILKSDWQKLSFQKRLGWRRFMDTYFIRDVPGRYLPHVNVLWASIISGWIRSELTRVLVLLTVENQELFYADTDSVIYCGNKELHEVHENVGDGIGQWSLKNEYSFFQAVGLKNYLFLTASGDVGAVASGIPLNNRPKNWRELQKWIRKNG